MHLTIRPTYGRDYKSKREVLEAWNNMEDFIIESIGPHFGYLVSKMDRTDEDVTIRYDNLQKILAI